jgi:MFS family permease
MKPEPADPERTNTTSPPRLERRSEAWISAELVRVLAAASSWSFAFSCFNLLPGYLVRELHATPSGIGLVMGAFGCASFALTPLSGAAIDRHRHRRTILAGALLACATAIGYLMVDSIGATILGLRVAQALSHALVSTAVGVAVAEIAPPERLAQALGLGGASILIMNALAPAVAEPLAAAAGWKAVFWLSSATALVSAALAASLEEPPPHETIAKERVSVFSVLQRPVALHYALVVVLIGLAAGTVFTFQQPFALELGMERVRGFLVAWAAAAIFVRIFFGHVPDRYGRHRVATASLTTFGLAALAMMWMRPGLMEILGGVFGIAHGLLYPSLNAIAVNAVTRRERGRLMAIFTGAFNLGVTATALLGLVAERTGYPPLFAFAAAAALTGACLLAGSRELRGERMEIRAETPSLSAAS